VKVKSGSVKVRKWEGDKVGKWESAKVQKCESEKVKKWESEMVDNCEVYRYKSPYYYLIFDYNFFNFK